MSTSGISTSFEGLSRSLGQVPHVLRTRSPLRLPESCDSMVSVRLACFKHAASVRPEPGSNSPSRSSAPSPWGRRRKSVSSRVGLAASPTGFGRTMVVVRSKHKLQKLLTSTLPRERCRPRCGSPHWLLNLPLFRFQSAIWREAHCSSERWCRCCLSSRSRRRSDAPVAVRGEGRLYLRPSRSATCLLRSFVRAGGRCAFPCGATPTDRAGGPSPSRRRPRNGSCR